MKILSTFFFIFITHFIHAQTAVVRGLLQGPEGEVVAYANVALFSTGDSSLYKVGTSNDAGIFEMPGLGAGSYSRRASLSMGYRFGNDNVKSRKRSTGIEAEAGRVGE